MRVRKARQEDVAAVARLLFESAPDMYDALLGRARARARHARARLRASPATWRAARSTWLAELDGRPAAAMAAFPVAEAADRSRAFLGLTLRGTPFWRWPGTLRLYWVGGRASPKPREDSLYVDALATDPALPPARRRPGAAGRGRARGARARPAGASRSTPTMNNEGARALYAAAGFDEVAYRAPSRGLPGFVALLKPVDR